MKKKWDLQKRVDIDSLRLGYLAGEISTADVAHQLNCAEDEALDRIGVTELRRTLAYSPEEIEAMYQRNENFNGKRADFDKLRLFQEIKAGLTKFLQRCGDVRKLEEIKPNQYENDDSEAGINNEFLELCREDALALVEDFYKWRQELFPKVLAVYESNK